jgi:hypothetical protein
MKNLVIAALLFLSIGDSSAQAPNIEWQKSFGGTGSDEASVIRPTFDGGYIVTGLSQSIDGDVTDNHGGHDHWVLKLDDTGHVQWKRSYGGTLDDKGYDIQQTADSGYVLTGYASSADGDVTGNHGSTDYWVVKLDDTGGITWQKALGGTSADNAYSIRETFDGGYAVMGLSISNNTGDVTNHHGTFDFWFCKLSATGSLEWEKSLGSTSTDQGFGLEQTTDSGYIICGYSSGNNDDVTTNNGGSDYWIVKLTPAGAIQWQKSYGGTGSDRAFNVMQTSDGGYLVNGVSASADGDVIGNHGGNDFWVLKLDTAGAIQWQHALGGTGDDFGRSVWQTIDGGYVVAGKTNTPNDGDVSGNHGDYDYWIVKLDTAGAIEWQQCYGGTGTEAASGATVPFMSVTQLPDGKYIMAGESYSTDGDVAGNTSSGSTDDNYWIVKLFGCPSYQHFTDTICYHDSYLFNGVPVDTTGNYNDTIPSVSGCDSVIILNLYVRAPLAPVITYSTGQLATTVFISYQWLLNNQVIPGATLQTYTPLVNGSYRVLVTGANACADTSVATVVTNVSVGTIPADELLRLYPNPFHDGLLLEYAFTGKPVKFSIQSMDGKIVLSGIMDAPSKTIHLGNLDNGIYFLKLDAADPVPIVRKIIKE